MALILCLLSIFGSVSHSINDKPQLSKRETMQELQVQIINSKESKEPFVSNIKSLQEMRKFNTQLSLFSTNTDGTLTNLDSTVPSPRENLFNQHQTNANNLLMHQFVSKLYQQKDNQNVYLTASPVLDPTNSLHEFPPDIRKMSIKKDSFVDPIIISSFRKIVWPATLIELRLIDLDITSKILSTIVYLPQTLMILNLGHNKIVSLHGFEFPSRLQVLHLNNNQITSRALQRIDLSGMQGLTHLFLGNNKITSLASIKWPPNLRYLHLNQNEIDTFGLMSIQLPSNLYMLDLRNNKIESFYLVNFPKNLKILALDGNMITSQQLYRLINNYLPRTVIYLNVCNNKICSLKKVNGRSLQQNNGVLDLTAGNDFLRGHLQYFRRRYRNITLY